MVVLDFQRPILPDLSNDFVTYCAVQLQKEAREKEETLQRMLSAEKRVRILEEENRQLWREATEVRKELDRLRKEVSQYLSISICFLINHADGGGTSHFVGECVQTLVLLTTGYFMFQSCNAPPPPPSGVYLLWGGGGVSCNGIVGGMCNGVVETMQSAWIHEHSLQSCLLYSQF